MNQFSPVADDAYETLRKKTTTYLKSKEWAEMEQFWRIIWEEHIVKYW